MIEKDFDISFIASLALKEKQIQQNYRPIIAVHKWFARRPGTLFRGLLLSEFSNKPLSEVFYLSNDFSKIKIADPFMGGGTPLLEANRIGCDVIGYDINPMSYWIVKREIEHLDAEQYNKAANFLRGELEKEVGAMFRTKCGVCGDKSAIVKYYLWVKTIDCHSCKKSIDLFPGYLLSSDARHPKNVFVCPSCGQLTETGNKLKPGNCKHCGAALLLNGPARHNHCKCLHCGTENSFPDAKLGPPQHRLFALEYYCPSCKNEHNGRYFKVPDKHDLNIVAEAEKLWKKTASRFVPTEEIPSGDETDRLHRWGYRRYREMFNTRQLLGLELSARIISKMKDERVKNALATNLSDLLRYQNMLCRYDTVALKSLDIFSVHGFPIGLIQCESNLLGIWDAEKGICVGSGGWINIIDKYRKAKAYCDAPFEARHNGIKNELVPIKGEWIGDCHNSGRKEKCRIVDIHCGDSAALELQNATLDAVLTDPPYFGNVQYAELMDFCYVWLRRLIGDKNKEFKTISTRNSKELTGNVNMGRDLGNFTEGLSTVFRKMVKALKPGSPLVFTYHHNTLEAYYPVGVAILDAGLTCTASLPCPAEMGASIHINGTGSSIIDTVFVCRTKGTISRKKLPESLEGVAALIRADLAELQQGKVNTSLGDVRCIIYGHLVRLAVWNLRNTWDNNKDTLKKIEIIASWLRQFGSLSDIEHKIKNVKTVYNNELLDDRHLSKVCESMGKYGDKYADISF